MSAQDVSLLEEAKSKHAESVARLDELNARIKALPDDAATDEVEFLRASFEKEQSTSRRWAEAAERTQVILDARSALAPQDEDEKSEDGKPRLSVKEPLTYQRTSPYSFFRDQLDAAKGDSEAMARLQRHASEMRVEQRDISTTAGGTGEFVPPTYLQDQWIPLLRAGRPTANLMNSRPLIPGTMVYHFPKLSGGGATAIQTADNAAIQETDPTSADYSVSVRTIAGQVDISRQLYDFSNPGMDEIIMADLAADYATKLDVQVLSGSGSSGQALGIRNIGSINTITYTQATPTAATLYSQIANAWQTISTTIFRNADAIVMHPRRWASILAASDTTGRPLASPYSPFNSPINGGVGSNDAQGAAGNLQGLPVYLDPNIPINLGAGTNQDIVLVLRTAEMYLYEEGSPRTRVFEDVGSGTQTVRISAWGYFAFAGGRYPGAISLITGTGLVAPTF
jgi:HK97 family phage major capsid protein